MTDSEDVSSVARQLADLTQTVEELQSQLEKFWLELKLNKNARTPNKSELTSRREN
jgi:hypothetical protein